MLARLFLSAAAISVLGGCGNFGFGNFSLGNNSELVALHPKDGYAEDREWRESVAQVTALRIERTASGAILHAQGLPPRQGYWDAELVAENGADSDADAETGVKTYVFRIAPSVPGTRSGPARSREVHVATFLSTAALDEITRIRVVGTNNSMIVRR